MKMRPIVTRKKAIILLLLWIAPTAPVPANAGDLDYGVGQEPSLERNPARLWSQTKLMFGLGVVATGILYAMPESVTGWDRDVSPADLPARWWNNVSRPPIWDTDDWFFNYVGHPYCGGVYYQMARKSGYGSWGSFIYSTVMSTFFWEYGVEAFAERPSVQDLLLTSTAGWIYGEWAFRKERNIRANQGRLMGSRILGGTALFFLDPVDHLGDLVNRLTRRDWVITGSAFVHAPPPGGGTNQIWDTNVSPRIQLGLKTSF